VLFLSSDFQPLGIVDGLHLYIVWENWDIAVFWMMALVGVILSSSLFVDSGIMGYFIWISYLHCGSHTLHNWILLLFTMRMVVL
jgi:hypothetical protein